MKIDYSVYLVTDRATAKIPLDEAVQKAIEGGCTIVQLREKDLPSGKFYDEAVKIKRITDINNIPLIINDRADIALAVDAAGVHVGQSDLRGDLVRKIIGPHKILGVSAVNTEQAVAAVQHGADYIGVGAIFPTGTKSDADYVSLDELANIRKAVQIPLIAIGGINKTNITQLKGSSIDGVALVSAILAGGDVKAATANMKQMFIELK